MPSNRLKISKGTVEIKKKKKGRKKEISKVEDKKPNGLTRSSTPKTD